MGWKRRVGRLQIHLLGDVCPDVGWGVCRGVGRRVSWRVGLRVSWRVGWGVQVCSWTRGRIPAREILPQLH